ncbi:MAG: glycosyltransferase WbuB, partial [Lachnospiraceae bacterium]
MNVLFLSLMQYSTIEERDIYTDLLREFIRNGHIISILSPTEENEQVISEENCVIIKVPTGKIEKTSFLQKGINTILIGYRFEAAIKKHLSQVHFDLVLYPTPPITFVGAVEYVKKRDGAKTYLMLKDIFPQNAIDIGVMSIHGVKGLIYRFFCRKERQLYAVSDHIGCMSQANVDYLIANHPELNPKKVGICPNCIEIVDKSVDAEKRRSIRRKYGIPEDRTVFVYGGNLGRPQGIPFLVECLKTQRGNENLFFLV